VANESTVLIYGTNLGGYRAAYAFCKKGYKVILLNRGGYVDEIPNQALAQLPLDFCWICGHMPQRLFKAIGCLTDCYHAELLEVSGKAGHFKVKFRTRDQLVNNFACAECDRCIEVCPVKVGDRKAIFVHPEAGWENIYLIDWEHCDRCGKCQEICPTGALQLDRTEQTKEVDVGAIVLAPEFDQPTEEDLAGFGLGKTPRVIKNSTIAQKSLLTNFVRDSIVLPSGDLPKSFGIVITPHFNTPGLEFENYNLSVSAVYRAVRLKELFPDAETTIFLRDYRGFGKRHYLWYQKAKDAGIRVVKTLKLEMTPQGDEKVAIEYQRDGKTITEQVELAILVTGQKPPTQMKHLSAICGVQADDRGFCRVRPFSSCETDVDGIFAVGEFTGPKGNPETIWEGCAVLTEALRCLGDPNFQREAPPPLQDFGGQKPKVGVFICSCFGRFNEHMDMEALRNQTENVPGVSHAEIITACCTAPTIKETAERIKKSGVNRVVLAVCTPLQKLLKYQKTVMMAGLNPLLTEYVRLREDVINVHKDRDQMLRKALALIRVGIERARRGTQAATPTDAFTPHALIIGAGPSGLAAAEGIASNGFTVTLVERSDTLGGRVEYLTPDEKNYVLGLAARVESDSNIAVLTQATLKSTTGYAGNFQATISAPDGDVSVDSGVIILATGAGEYRPDGFLYGQDSRVLTQLELQERLAKISWGRGEGLRVAMIQCVGSKDDQHPYCSRVCCHQALENAVALRRKKADVTIFYRDMTVYGPDDLYKKAKDRGVKFVRFDGQQYPQVRRNEEGLEVVTADDEGQGEYDLVVLSTGIVPDGGDNKRLSALLDYPLDGDGFFDSDANAYPYEEAIKRLTKPYEWATNCIFPVGLAHSPRGFDECLLTARDAAGRALTIMGKKRMPPPNAMYVAAVKESFCMGCGICVDACMYSARHIDPLRKVAVVHPFLCDSCGSCVAICPNDASYLTDFKSNQPIAALDVLLDT
jgi:heterodisulfide reductase subunit A